MSAPLQVRTLVSRLFDVNCYVVWPDGQRDCLVIDPGLEPDLILELLRDEGLTARAVLNTHGHADHIAGNAALKAAFPDAPLVIGANDTHMLSDADANLSAPFGLALTSPPADRTVKEGDVVE